MSVSKEAGNLRLLSSEGSNGKKLIAAVLIVIISLGLLLTLIGAHLLNNANATLDVFVGVDIGYGDENDVYRIADAVSGYANLIIIGSLAVTNDTAQLTRVCDYLFQKGFSFIIYVGFASVGYLPPRGPESGFFKIAAERWGDLFLGAYVFDEPGGKQIDSQDKVVSNASNYSDAAEDYVYYINQYLIHYTHYYYDSPNLKTFTSDYALYWYDYSSGYDVVLGQFVGNNSREITVKLTRGAADVMKKDWGVIITWKYNEPPYLEEPEQMYSDMVFAYQNGAKYVAVFNSPETHPSPTPFGTLTTEHLNAMKRFWDFAKAHPRQALYKADTAYVLPMDYGYGFRDPNDKIWGLWEDDSLSPKIWNDVESLIARYGVDLDVVYEKGIGGQPVSLPYKRLIFWNATNSYVSQVNSLSI